VITVVVALHGYELTLDNQQKYGIRLNQQFSDMASYVFCLLPATTAITRDSENTYPKEASTTVHEIASDIPKLGDQKARSLEARLIRIEEMANGNDQSSVANIVGRAAEDFRLRSRKVWDLTTVLEVLSVPKQHHTLDLVFDGSTEPGDGIAHNGSSLTVAASHNRSARTFASGKVEKPLSFSNSGLGCTGR
jgi:hypothetical protein